MSEKWKLRDRESEGRVTLKGESGRRYKAADRLKKIVKLEILGVKEQKMENKNKTSDEVRKENKRDRGRR